MCLIRARKSDYTCTDHRLLYLSSPPITYLHISDHLVPYPTNISESLFSGKRIWDSCSCFLTWLPCEYTSLCCNLVILVFGFSGSGQNGTWCSNTCRDSFDQLWNSHMMWHYAAIKKWDLMWKDFHEKWKGRVSNTWHEIPYNQGKKYAF